MLSSTSRQRCQDATLQGFKPVLMIPEAQQQRARTLANDRLDKVLSFVDKPEMDHFVKLKAKKERVELYQSEESQDGVCVFGSTLVECSITEMAQLVTVNTSDGFRMLMQLLHGNNFIDGTIVIKDIADKKMRGIDTEIGLLSVKWFAYHGGYLSKPKAFCMLDHTRRIDERKRPVLVRVMQPLPDLDYSFLTHSYDGAEMEYAIVAEEISDTHMKVTCLCQTANVTLRTIALSMVTDTLTEFEDTVVTARLSRKEMAVQWVQDHERLRCRQCCGAFSAFRRRHHCRICGEIVCSSCSSIRKALLKNGVGIAKMRVCKACCRGNVVKANTRLNRSSTYGAEKHKAAYPQRKFTGALDLLELIESLDGQRLEDIVPKPVQRRQSSQDPSDQEQHRRAVLETLGRPVFKTVRNISRHCEIAMATLGASCACVAIVGKDSVFFEYTIGIEMQRVDRIESLADLVFASKGPLIIQDCLADERVSDAEFVDQNSVRFFAGAAIRYNNASIGCLYVFDPSPRFATNAMDTAVMQKVSDMLTNELNS